MPDGGCQEGRSGKSAERAVTSAGVTYGRENLGGFVTTVHYAVRRPGFASSRFSHRGAHYFGGDRQQLAAFCPRLSP